MTINNKSERNYRGKYLGSPFTSYGDETDSSWNVENRSIFYNSLGCHMTAFAPFARSVDSSVTCDCTFVVNVS